MDKHSVAPPTTTPPNVVCLPKCRANGLEVDCCVRKQMKRLVCPPPPQPTTTCSKSSPWRWECKICGYFSRYFHKAEECEKLHFGPLIPTPTDDINERDDDGDNNGWIVGGVVIRSHQPTPPGTSYPLPREQPTPPIVSFSDSEDVGVKLTVDDGPIVVAAEGIIRLHSKLKVSQSCCGLV